MAGAVEVLFAVCVPLAPNPVEPVPEPRVDEDPPAERALPVRPPAAAEAAPDVVVDLNDDDVVLVEAVLAVAPLVELVAILSIVAPRPAEPAEAVPVDEPDLPPLDVLGGVETVTVGVLVKVAPVVAEAPLPVLVKV